MRAIALDSFGAPAAPVDLPEPTAGQGELFSRVSASSANPVDNAIAGGMLQGMFDHEFPITLGRGELRVPIQRTYAFQDAADSLSDLTGRHTQGKLAIEISS